MEKRWRGPKRALVIPIGIRGGRSILVRSISVRTYIWDPELALIVQTRDSHGDRKGRKDAFVGRLTSSQYMDDARPFVQLVPHSSAPVPAKARYQVPRL